MNVDEQRCGLVGLREIDIEEVFLVRSVLDGFVVLGRDGAKLEGRGGALEVERLGRRRGGCGGIAAAGGDEQGCNEEEPRDSMKKKHDAPDSGIGGLRKESGEAIRAEPGAELTAAC